MWRESHDRELNYLDSIKAIELLAPSRIQLTTKPIPLTMRYAYKYNGKGKFIAQKARCTVRGDVTEAHISYDPDQTSNFMASKPLVRFAFAFAVHHHYVLEQFEITSSFLHKPFKSPKPVYIHQLRRFSGKFTHPDKPIGLLKLNLYVTRNEGWTYSSGLYVFLINDNWKQSDAD